MIDNILFIIVLVLLCIWIPLVFSAIFNYQLGKIIRIYREFACHMGWHSHPHFKNAGPSKKDPLAFLIFHAECEWCKYKGQIDGQGNLF